MCVWWLIRPSTGRNKHNHCCPPLCREQLITNGSVSVHTITTCFQHALINIIGETSILFFCRQKSCRDKHVFVATKHVFCRDKSMLVRQNVCFICLLLSQRDKTSFVETNTCLSRQKYFVATNIICYDKCFVAADIHVFVATKRLSRQNDDTCGSSGQ